MPTAREEEFLRQTLKMYHQRDERRRGELRCEDVRSPDAEVLRDALHHQSRGSSPGTTFPALR